MMMIMMMIMMMMMIMIVMMIDAYCSQEINNFYKELKVIGMETCNNSIILFSLLCLSDKTNLIC